MHYSVIYSFDIAPEDSVDQFGLKPPKTRSLWTLTECEDREGDLDYVGMGKHRKYCAFLNAEQFQEFVDQCGLEAEDVETMGSLGAPGLGIGVAPAISFNGTDSSCYQNAYVTPVPNSVVDGRRTTPFSEQDWERVRSAVITKFAA